MSHSLYVSPDGDDGADGTRYAPFHSLHHAQEVVRELVPDMDGDIVVNVAAGEYRFDRPLRFTPQDSGRNGFNVVYRSESGPDDARILGSRILTGWKPLSNGIWKVDLPEGMLFHTLYENGVRAYKARFPDRDNLSDMPVAAGGYLYSVDGTPKRSDKQVARTKRPAWLTYNAEDAPPVTDVTKMQIHIFPGGKFDWVREVHPVHSIDPDSHRIVFGHEPAHGVGTGSRFFLEDEFGFLNAPGEFFVDEKAGVLYYKPMGGGHPDALSISMPVITRLIEFRGDSIESCVGNIVIEGIALGETDNSPPKPMWAYNGMTDGALIWMNNTSGITIRNCHLKNGGRNGVMMIGHNMRNRVTGCWIEHMGLNGVSFCNKFLSSDRKERTPGRCMFNRLDNSLVSHIGELHTYAECVTVFNVSSNEVDHCQLDNSVRYAITVRGNTGPQYGPPVNTAHPPCRGNNFHHIRVFRCGQDGGDMGALHCANLNNPGDGNVNVFNQITVADSQAISSMRDQGPNGIFLDWPKMAMDQVFKNIHIIRSQGGPFRSHRPENGDSIVWENLSWKPGFKEELMDYDHIGLTDRFPEAFGGSRGIPNKRVKVKGLHCRELAHNRASLEWDKVDCSDTVEYIVKCDGKEIGRSSQPQWNMKKLEEDSSYIVTVAARCGDFSVFGPESKCRFKTPEDAFPPKLLDARVSPEGNSVRLVFDESVDPSSVVNRDQYLFSPALRVTEAHLLNSRTLILDIEGYQEKTPYSLCVKNVRDCSARHNAIKGVNSVEIKVSDLVLCYDFASDSTKKAIDISGAGHDAVLHDGAVIKKGMGPGGRPALLLDGKRSYASASADLNLGPGDFTFAVWVYPENGGVVLSKGTNFGAADQWSFGCGELRSNNNYFRCEKGAVKNHRWNHLAFVRKGNVGIWYVNGKVSGGEHDLSVLGPLVNERLLRIGRREYEKNPTFFKGRIGSLCVYRRALSQAEVCREMGTLEDM